MIKPNKKAKIVYFVKEDEEDKEEELFPSSLLITPELLPTSSSKRKSDYLVEEMIIAIKRGNISVNAARDMFSEGSFSMEDDEQLEAAKTILNHILQVKEYAPSVKNTYVGILRALSQKNNFSAIIFGDLFIEDLSDERGLRTLIQAHGKCGNFSRPIELLKMMPKSQWKSEQISRFKTSNRILNEKINIKIPKIEKIKSVKKSIIYHASQKACLIQVQDTQLGLMD